MSNHSGKTIEPLKPGDPPKFLDTKFANQFVRLYNAVMNLRLKNGRALISDTAIDLELDASPASGGGGGSTPAGLPWQIELIADTGGPNDWRTFTVSPGAVYLQQPNQNYAYGSTALQNSVGTGANIVAADASYAYYFWAEITKPTSASVIATLASGTAIPAGWTAFPFPQAIDDCFNSGYSTGYLLIGYVSTLANPATITQLVFDNREIMDNSKNYFLTWLGPAWYAGLNFRLNTVVNYAGGNWIRRDMIYGDDGGTPGGVSDWVVFP